MNYCVMHPCTISIQPIFLLLLCCCSEFFIWEAGDLIQHSLCLELGGMDRLKVALKIIYLWLHEYSCLQKKITSLVSPSELYILLALGHCIGKKVLRGFLRKKASELTHSSLQPISVSLVVFIILIIIYN